MFESITTQAAAINHRHEMHALARHGHHLPARATTSTRFALLRTKLAARAATKPAVTNPAPTAPVVRLSH